MKILDILKQTDNKFVNMYDIVYEQDGRVRHWQVASRNSIDKLVCVTGKPQADTVSVVPRFVDKDGDEAIILNREFRVPIGDYVYSFVSGLVEEGESPVESCLREMEEEIGAKAEDVSELHSLTGITFKSEGLTDETAIVFEAATKKIGKQNLQGGEDIKVEIVKIKDLEKFIAGKHLSTMAGIYLSMIAREYELRKQIQGEKDQGQPGN